MRAVLAMWNGRVHFVPAHWLGQPLPAHALLAARRENVSRPTSANSDCCSPPHTAIPPGPVPHLTIPPRPPFASAAYAGHAVLKQLFPWRFSSLDRAIKPLVADLTEEQRTAAVQVGRDAAIEVLTAR